MDISGFFSSTPGRIIAIVLGAILLNICGRFAIRIVIRRSVKRLKGETKLDRQKRVNTITNILITTYIALVWIIAFCAVLAALGVNVAALLTGAGLIGVFVGLSAQNTVKDFLAGMFLLIEKQYRVGDTITFLGGTMGGNGPSGVVEEITLRITKLRDINGQLITVRNGEPTIITNQTLNYATIVLDITVTYTSDMALVEQTINKVGKQQARSVKWRDIIEQPMTFLRIDNFTDQGVIVRITGNVAPANQWKVAGDYRRMLFDAFAKNSKIAFAHTSG